jgi:hypothetical protein
MLYRDWSGQVTGARIRVPTTIAVGIAAYGPSANPISIRAGAVGTIVDILPEGGRTPTYVRFPRLPNLALAAEVRYRRGENTAVMWKDFYVSTMKEDEALVVIPRGSLDALEIEYTKST